MRVLLLGQFYPPVIGGEERHIRNLAVALAGRGHDVHVACLDVGQPPDADPGVTLHPLDNLGVKVPALYPQADRPLALPAPDPWVTAGLARLVERLRPDVVHAHNWILNSYLPLPAARRLPLVCSLHDYSHVCATKRLMDHGRTPCAGPSPRKCMSCTTEWYGTGRGPVIWSLARAGRPVRNRLVDVFTPVSRFVAQANALDAQGVPWQVVPNFVPDGLLNHPKLPRDPALPAGDFLFFAGDLSRQKGIATLVAAYGRLEATSRPALVLVGRPTDELPPLPAGAVVHEKWDHPRVLSAFQHALAAVLPSEWPDPCPTTVLEAMALGAPLVTTSMGGIPDMVTHAESALVVEPGDVPGLAHTLGRIAAEPALRSRIADRAAVEVRRFVQSRVAADLDGLYQRLVDQYVRSGAAGGSR